MINVGWAVMVAATCVVGPSALAASATTTPVATSTSQTVACVAPHTAAPADITTISAAQRRLDIASAWTLSRGAGITVAVIDTGVTPHPQLEGRLKSGTDRVVPTDRSLVDCDGHGTLVAGLIAASPDPTSGFAGVAPEATILSLRQSSARYQIQASDGRDAQPVGNLTTLAAALDEAVAAGAKVVNISETSCAAAGASTGGGEAGMAAAVERAIKADVVVVAAAGNVSTSGSTAAVTRGSCSTQNQAGQPPVTVPLPASLPGVLAVAAVDANDDPASFSLNGPWVGVAAPGTGIISLDPAPGGTGLVDREFSSDGSSESTIQGTSFATPYVAGLAALIRSRNPSMTASAVIALIEDTARHPASWTGRTDAVGAGVIDPVLALSAVPDPRSPAAAAQLPAAVAAPAPDHTGRDRALLISGLILVAGLVVVLVAAQLRRPAGRRRSH